jgi:subtilisin family serine protease
MANNCREEILSEEYRDFLVSSFQEELFCEKFPDNECEQTIGSFYKSIYVNQQQADPIQFDRYPYNSVPKCFTLIDVEAMEQAGILAVQNYPTLSLQGSGVLIGFVDTGIDYQNPIFRNLDGSSRVVGLWDQTIQEGTPPNGFSYGTEYRKAQIDEALRSDPPLSVVPSVDTNGHGTFLISLAAGGVNEENQFIGAAPNAGIAVVKLKPAKQYLKDFYLIGTEAPCYQENDIMLGISYLNQLAEELNLPLVICIALGTNFGSHAASSPLTNLLEVYGNIANRAVVIGGGNEANQRHHFLGQIESVNQTQQVEVRVGENVNGFCVELWCDALNLLTVSITSPSGEQTYRFPIRSERTDSYTFVLERTTVTVDYKVFVERLNAELIFFRFISPTPGIWKVNVEAIQVQEGEYHLWLPVTEFLENEVFFLTSNPDYTITEPGSTISGITVGFYNGNDNSVAIQSGRGYTRGERVKPDFVAPGVDVRGATNRNQFAVRTGSSIAAGITAGAAALIMEWVVYELQRKTIDSTQIRNLLVLGTTKRPNESYPNREWGYGQLNVYNTFETIRQI